MTRKSWILVVVALTGLLGFAPAAPANDFTWQGGVSSNWSDAGNWTPGGGPPNATTDTARIDNNPLVDVTVYLNNNYQVNQLKVDVGDTLAVNDGKILYLGGTDPVQDFAEIGRAHV